MTTKPVIYGSKLSVSTRRVLLVLEEKNIDYDFVAINTAKGEQKVSYPPFPLGVLTLIQLVIYSIDSFLFQFSSCVLTCFCV